MRGTANGTLPHGPADAAGVAVTEPILSARKSLLRVPGRVGVGRGAGTGCEGVCLFPGLALGGRRPMPHCIRFMYLERHRSYVLGPHLSLGMIAMRRVEVPIFDILFRAWFVCLFLSISVKYAYQWNSVGAIQDMPYSD